MADDINVTNNADLMAGEVLAAEFLLLLAERGDILNHPALMHISGRPGSNVVRVPHYGLDGYDILGDRTPGTEVSNTALSDGYTDVTCAPKAKRYTLDDVMRFVVDGKLDPSAWARDCAISHARTLMYMICNLVDNFATTAGTSGVNASWSDVVDAKTKLAINKATGQMLGIVHPRQWGDLEVAALSLGGAAQHEPGLVGVVAQGLGQYKGRVMGIDWFADSNVPTANAGADRAGGIFTRGAIAWADVEYPAESDSNMYPMGRALLERVRQGTYGQTAWMSHAIVGAAEGIDLAGVSLITDA